MNTEHILEQHRLWLEGRGEGERANLARANLAGVDLVEADLSGADLSRANLEKADLTYANLTGANLCAANLTGANLCAANLMGANLTGANLTGADLEEANLTEANLTKAELKGADLCSVKGKLIFAFQINKHFAYYCDEILKIGCVSASIYTWKALAHEIGEEEGYTENDVKNYLTIINVISELI